MAHPPAVTADQMCAFVREFMGGPACLAFGASRGQPANVRAQLASAALVEMLGKKENPSEAEMSIMMDTIQVEDDRLVVLKIVDSRGATPVTLPVAVAVKGEGVRPEDLLPRG